MANPAASRRSLLRAAGIAALAVPTGAMAPRAAAPVGALFDPLSDPSAICRTAAGATPALAAPGARRQLKLTWNANAICTAGVPVAKETGIFERYNLDVEFINFGGSTDQLLEAIATGKADGGIGMALRWLKPLEQGFDVRITAGTHGGCMRLFTQQATTINSVQDLRGKRIGVADMAAPDKNFFAILARHAGIDPDRDITWRQFPGDLLGEALKRGDVDAISQSDPLGWIVRERDNLREVANNLTGQYANRVCCVVGLRGSLIRDDLPAARALTAALLEAQHFVHDNPDRTAEIFAPYARVPTPQLAAMLRSHTHGHNPVGRHLEHELAGYIDDLKLVNVMRRNTDPARLAARIHTDVLGGAA